MYSGKQIIGKYWENIFCSLVCLLFFLFSHHSFAADSLSYSGRLVKADGSPVTGPVNLKIDLAYTDFPNTILCSQNFSSVVLSNGVFHLKLDLVCPGPPVKTVTEILSAVPASFSAALRVSDVTNSKIYAFQEIHSMPFATVSESAKQLAQMGAVNGEVLRWNNTSKKWEPSTPGGGGTVSNVTATSPLAVTSGATTPALTITQATTSSDGYLSATDWNTFNNKVGVATGGTTLQFYRGDNSWQTLNTSVVPESGVSNLYFSNARVLGVPLDGFIAGPGVIVASDTVLQAFAKTQGQINLINTNSSAYVTKTGTSTLAAGTIDAQAGFVLVGAPGNINDATPRGYVDTQDNLKVNKAGDTITGVLTLNNDLLIKGGSNYVTLKGHATSAAYNFILPPSAGLVGEVLKTDGAGNLSWINPATLAAGSATVDSTAIVNGTIVDADIANTTITYAKLNLSDGDIPLAKLNGVSDATKYLRADKSWQTLNGAAVANTPAGNLAATSTQAALNELDSEKEAAVTAGLITDYYKGNKTWSDLGADVRASQLTGLGAGTNTALVATDSILTAFQNTQAQINNKQNTISKTTDQDLKSVRLYGANATNYVELTAGTLTANRSLIFPDANGTSGQVLTTNGAGVLSWSSAATTASAVGGDLSGTIANAQLGAGVVGNTELAADAVVSANILDGTIVNADLANTTIAYAKLNLVDGDIPLTKINGASDASKYLRGDKSWSTFATDAIASALAGFTPFATKTDITATDSIFTAFQKTQKQLDDIDGDYVSKAGNNTVTGTFNISGITAFLNIPTPTGTTLSEAANVDYVKTYVGTLGQWNKNGANIYFNTGNVGIGTNAPSSSSILDLASTTKGFSPPRATKAQRDAIVTPTQGLLVFNTTDNTLDYYNGANWLSLNGSAKYIKIGMSGYQSVVNGSVIAFDSVRASSGMTLSGNGIALKAGVTYRIEAMLNTMSASGFNYLGYIFNNGTSNIGQVAYSDEGENTAYGFKAGLLEIYKPTVDEVISIKITDNNIGTGQVTPNYNTYFTATELVPSGPAGGGSDNLGNHTASQNINLGSFWLSGDGTNTGLRVNNTGKVGIGTSTPTEALQVIGNSTITSGAGNITLTPDYFGVGVIQSYQTAGVFRPILIEGNGISLNSQNSGYVLLNGGNVGIGTTTPGEKLHVSGGNVEISSNTTMTSVGASAGLRIYDTNSSNNDYLNIGWIAENTYGLQSSDSGTYQNLILNPFGGNVGLGTTTPETRFDLNGSQVTRGDSNGYVMFAPKTGTSAFGVNYDRFEIRVDNTNQLTLLGNTHGGTGTSRSLGLMAGGSERIRIDGVTGSVGIGANPSIAKFESHVNFSSPFFAVTPAAMFVNDGNANNGSALTIDLGSGQGLANLVGGAKITSDGTGYKYIGTRGASRIVLGDGAISLYTGNTGTGTANTPVVWSGAGGEALTINSSGNVGIGTNSPSYTLHVNGSVAGTSAYNNLSDERFKNNIKNIPNSLEKLTSLDGVYYNFKTKEFPDKKFSNRREMGVIAQKVETIFPEAVTKDTLGFRSVAYSMLIAPIIESIKEIKNWLLSHDQAIAKLEAENAQIKARADKAEKENLEIKIRLQKLESAILNKK